MTNKTEQSSRGIRARRAASITFFALLSLWLPIVAEAQWATNGDNINNTNTGNVGVGTAAPATKLDVRGDFVLEAGRDPYLFTGTGTSELYRYLQLLNSPGYRSATGLKVGGVLVSDSYDFANPGKNDLIVKGNVGIGTASPGAKLVVTGGVDTNLQIGDRGMSGSVGMQMLGSGYKHVGLRFDGDNLIVENASNTGAPSTWYNGQPMNFILRNGKVGVGTTAPTTALHVVGDITVTGNINAKYQDVAEWVPTTQKLAAGTVVVLDPERPNHVLASKGSYDTAVAGVISEKPGLTLGEAGGGKALVATTGRVKVRVDATRAPIKIGDLLVTSEVEGVAMKSEPVSVGGRRMHAPGTIIGKALEPLAAGTGEILVLLSLQ